MKQLVIWAGIFLFLCFVISIPIMEENYHIKHDPNYLKDKYELHNPYDTAQDTK